MKKTVLLFILTLTLCPACLAQNQTYSDTFTITTYYPAPHGVYGTMRLYPGQLPSEGVAPGVLYYNATEDMLKFHNNTTWVNVTGGGGGGGIESRPGDPNSWPAEPGGKTVYSQARRSVYYSNGERWVNVMANCIRVSEAVPAGSNYPACDNGPSRSCNDVCATQTESRTNCISERVFLVNYNIWGDAQCSSKINSNCFDHRTLYCQCCDS